MENSCDYSADIDGYVHGELNGRKLSDFEIHLQSCLKCKQEVEALGGLRNALDKSFAVSLDERFDYSVIRDLRVRRKVPSGKEIRIALEDIIISLATLLVIFLIGVQFLSKPKVSSVEMAGKLDRIERSSLEQTSLSNDQVLELVVRNK